MSSQKSGLKSKLKRMGSRKSGLNASPQQSPVSNATSGPSESPNNDALAAAQAVAHGVAQKEKPRVDHAVPLTSTGVLADSTGTSEYSTPQEATPPTQRSVDSGLSASDYVDVSQAHARSDIGQPQSGPQNPIVAPIALDRPASPSTPAHSAPTGAVPQVPEGTSPGASRMKPKARFELAPDYMGIAPASAGSSMRPPAIRSPEAKRPSIVRANSGHGSSGYSYIKRTSSAISLAGASSERRLSRAPLSRNSSLAQLAREHRLSTRDHNDTRAFYNDPGSQKVSPAVSRTHSYTHLEQREADSFAMDYLGNTSTSAADKESSNFLYRTGSWIQTENAEFGAWYPTNSSRMSSRRNSVHDSTSSSEAEEGDEVDVLHVGRRFRHSRRNSLATGDVTALEEAENDEQIIIDAGPSDAEDEDQDDWDAVANSRLIRLTDWFLGLPHNSPNSLREIIANRNKPMDPAERRVYREQSLVGDPAWLMALGVVFGEFVR